METKQLILNKIKECDRIILVRHIRPDGDCVGATLGFKYLLKESFPNKEIKVYANDYIDYLDFLGKEDDDESIEKYEGALIIALDTAVSDRISNSNYCKGKELIKIDHHIEVDKYGDINWVDDSRSSCCEMIVEFYDTFKDELKMPLESATALYTGIISDSGRFKFSSVNGNTLRLSAILLDKGIDIETIAAHLYLKDFNVYQLQGDMLKSAKITENGVAYIYVTEDIQKKYNLSLSDASSMISVIDSIKGSLIWLAFIDNPDGTIRVRLRSRFMTVNQIASKHHGGGHDKASGATCYSKEEMEELIKEADIEIKKYKESHNDWL